MTDFIIDAQNSNRYAVKVKESSGFTVYCFSTPIYHAETGRIIQLSLIPTPTGFSFCGTNARLSVCQNRCVLENREGKITLVLPESPAAFGTKKAECSTLVIKPTLNGFLLTARKRNLIFSLESEGQQSGIRVSPNCFSVMREEFRPFCSLAALTALQESSCQPVLIRQEEIGKHFYRIEIGNEQADLISFEINLYEPKLFQDTPLESLHPDANNAFGAMAFLGKTRAFGEQWLYTRPDFSKIKEFCTDRIRKAILNIPVFGESTGKLEISAPATRFCSFGSTWNKKVSPAGSAFVAGTGGRFLSLDVSEAFTNKRTHTLAYNEGLILRATGKKNRPVAISTGDCYAAPQILELKF